MDWAKRHRGRLRMSASRSYSPFPGPQYGGRVSESVLKIFGAQNLSDWSKFFPGHWALVFPKLQWMRLQLRAWLC